MENILKFLFGWHYSTQAIALVGALIAFRVYRRAKADEVRTAAALVLQEIRQAEKQIAAFRDQPQGFLFHQSLAPLASWDINKKLFIGLLEENHFDDITEFFTKAKRVDQLIQMIQEQRYSKFIDRVVPAQINALQMKPESHEAINQVPQNLEESSETIKSPVENSPNSANKLPPLAIHQFIPTFVPKLISPEGITMDRLVSIENPLVNQELLSLVGDLRDQLIYNSIIGLGLRKIAKFKLYSWIKYISKN